ncbi:NDMA-dependent alcohol dehydrogenase [Tsukamurella sp. NPDC003166]|uniref:NDMA-dependent alcohol dehydrogenase n=1 Tax=Tsukamurella sp. NPDC003166 TaxID=3154444 RepID=UPI0033AB0E49
MKVNAAVAVAAGSPLEIHELDLAGPEDGEVLVKMLYAGLCHSDIHITRGDLEARLPMVMGHEGAGIVESVGPGVTRVKPGDHVVLSFIPSCGVCRWCATGQQGLCDWGATILEGNLPSGRFAFTGPLGDYGAMCMLGTFSPWATVHQNSVVPVRDDLPLDKAALVGCGVPTGWGSAVNAADVRPGDAVIVTGIGGIGINAVQGAALAGARLLVAVDPLENKREAALRLGATHAFATVAEAVEMLQDETNGNGADKAIVTPGLVTEEILTENFDAVGKGGTVVLTGVNGFAEKTVNVPGAFLTFFNKTIKGSTFGHCNPTRDIPLVLDLYTKGQIKLDELITRTYRLDEINQGYDDLLEGRNLRGILVHEH